MEQIKEVVVYAIAGAGSLVILGYSVHMFIGGLVARETEILAIAGACTLGAAAIGYMAWDVTKRRRSRNSDPH